MRWAAKVDANQSEIVNVFREAGFSVLLLHRVGQGCPDCLIGKWGLNTLVEIKDGKRIPSERRLTQAESDFKAEWKGALYIIESVEQAWMLCEKLRHDNIQKGK